MRYYLAIAALIFVSVCASAGDIALPQPAKTGGPSVLQAIDARSSAGQKNFPSGSLSQQEVATLLWAATGSNRDGSKWTVPMAQGRQPYCKIYYITSEGAWLYRWQDHSLAQVSTGDHRAKIALQDFGKTAPAQIVFAFDGEQLARFGKAPYEEFAFILIGAMQQNMYLAAQALGVGVRVVYSIDKDAAASALGLDKADRVICGMYVGK